MRSAPKRCDHAAQRTRIYRSYSIHNPYEFTIVTEVYCALCGRVLEEEAVPRLAPPARGLP